MSCVACRGYVVVEIRSLENVENVHTLWAGKHESDDRDKKKYICKALYKGGISLLLAWY